jgi:glycosyltransferase involved in cell wall biosynthesis
MRVAIVHDWLITYAGAERVLEQILQCYPDADVFSLVDFLPRDNRGFIQNKHVTTSFVQRLPCARKMYRAYLPFMPVAVERFDFSSYDLIISTSHAVVKGIITTTEQLHICYLQARNLKYAYDDRRLYTGNRVVKFVQDVILTKLRVWDSIASQRPDVTIANSYFVAKWHNHRHKIACSVIYPPVDISVFNERFSTQKDEYYVTVGRIEPYKRFDLIVKAFNELGFNIKVIGDGTGLKNLEASASANVEFMGYQQSYDIAQIVARAKAFIFASREDFGIAPLEAQASGTPVIAYGKGGVLETVRGLGNGVEKPTGIFFHEQSVSAIVDAVRRFEHEGVIISAENCRENALCFSRERFRNAFTEFVETKWREFQLNNQEDCL